MDKEFLLELPKEVAEKILEEQSRIVEAYEGRLTAMAAEHAVALAIATAGGRSQKAIAALLDTDALAAAEDVDEAARNAVAQVKKECGYLFGTAPAFAPGTGTDCAPVEEPMSLAEALKEKFYGK